MPEGITGVDMPSIVDVADPTSDTINPTGESTTEPIVEAGVSEADIQTLQQQLVEQRRIQAGLDRAVSRATDQETASQQHILELEKKISAYNTADGANNDVITDYMDQLAALETERADWQQRAEEAIRSESRVRIVASEFPGLTALIDARALPQAGDDESFRASLAVLQDTFSSAADARLTEKAHGVKPPAAPPAHQPGDVNAIKRQMMKAEPGSEEFNRLREQWYTALGVSS